MRRIAVILTLAVVGIGVSSSAMDGIMICSILSTPTYKMEFSPGKLVKYTIANNLVVGVDTLPESNGGSPRINMSGTYFAYIKPTAGVANGRTLVIRAIDGATQTKEFPLEAGAVWLWWLNDGSMMYTVNVQGNPSLQGQCKVRKITFAKVNGQLVEKDIFWAKLDVPIQGGFVGISGTGARIAYAGAGQQQSCAGQPNCPYGGTGGFEMNGDSTKWLSLAKPDFGGQGCGWSVSPSGERTTQWIGGHNVVTWQIWGMAYPGCTFPCSVTFTQLNTTDWAVFRDSDPESKLEISIDGGATWTKNPFGVCGADNIWSCNSENWHLSEIGEEWVGAESDCVNMIAVSWKWLKAINVTKIMPVNPSTDKCQLRGVPFPGGVQRSADRGALWCSNQEDVYDSLWHYVQNRQADNLYWSDVLGLPPAQIPAVGVSLSMTVRRADGSISLLKRRSGVTVKMSSDAAYAIDIMDIAGRTVTTLRGHGSAAALPGLKTGSYVVKVRQLGMTRTERIADATGSL